MQMAAHLTSYYTTPNYVYDMLMSPANISHIRNTVKRRLNGLVSDYEIDSVCNDDNITLVITQHFNHYYNSNVSPNFINTVSIDAIYNYIYADKVERIKQATQDARTTLAFDGRYGMFQTPPPKMNKRRPDPICAVTY